MKILEAPEQVTNETELEQYVQFSFEHNTAEMFWDTEEGSVEFKPGKLPSIVDLNTGSRTPITWRHAFELIDAVGGFDIEED